MNRLLAVTASLSQPRPSRMRSPSDTSAKQRCRTHNNPDSACGLVYRADFDILPCSPTTRLRDIPREAHAVTLTSAKQLTCMARTGGEEAKGAHYL